MFGKKKLLVLLLICALISGAVDAMNKRQKERNLKVLPKDISDEKLDSIMHTYNKALNVECKFCHVKSNLYPFDFDYASDTEPMKETARNMMRMTIGVNQTWFYFDKNQRPEYLNAVTCITCHRGEAVPQE